MTSIPEAEAEFLRSFLDVSRETLDRLGRFEASLRQWQAKTNLVSPATLQQFWRRHIADSLQCLALKPDTATWVDLGAGGGFPGMPIAIANAAIPDRQHHLVESIHKKCAFLREAARVCDANATVHCERIESAAKRLAGDKAPPQVVTARALAPLRILLDLAEPLLAAGAVALFHKGRDYEAELRECHGLWKFDLVVHRSRVAPDSVLLEIAAAVRL